MIGGAELPADLERTIRGNARKIALGFAKALRPPERLSVSEWAASRRRFPDDHAYAGPYRNDIAPELVEIADCLSVHSEVTDVCIMKCAQSGGSVTAENWIGYIAEMAPAPALFVQATMQAAWDWASEKLWPMIEQTPALGGPGGAIVSRTVRGNGTVKNRIKFRRGGYVILSGANSAAGLRQRTVRYAVEDDLDQFPDDLDGQGAPEKMVTKRLEVWARRGLAKRLKISTPTIKGVSKIERAWLASDQRRHYWQCPHCASWFTPRFADLSYPDGRPDLATLTAPCCGAEIRHSQKAAIKRSAVWVPTCEEVDTGAPPRVIAPDQIEAWRTRAVTRTARGYHIPGIISSFLTWARLAEGYEAAKGDPVAMKGWTNLDEGEPYEITGDAPPAEELAELVETDWGADRVPPGALLISVGCDVQGDGIYVEKVGWGRLQHSWMLDAAFIPGATDVAGEGAWKALKEYLDRPNVFAGGKAYPNDLELIDARYNTDAVKAFCQGRARTLPVAGVDGWMRPLFGDGVKIAQRAGKKRLPWDNAYQVGTFPAKMTIFGNLRATLRARRDAENGVAPEEVRGLCRFGRHATPAYFEQLTSETCVVVVKSGQPARVWKVKVGAENHWLDCRVYNLAASDKMGVARMGPDDWDHLEAARCAKVIEAPPPLVATQPQAPARRVRQVADDGGYW